MGDGGLGKRRRRWKETLISTVCWLPVQGPESGALALFSPGSLLQALEMQSTLGLGVAAIQGAPCRFFPNRSCLILRNQVRAHALHLQPRCIALRYSGKCEVRIPTCLEVTG